MRLAITFIVTGCLALSACSDSNFSGSQASKKQLKADDQKGEKRLPEEADPELTASEAGQITTGDGLAAGCKQKSVSLSRGSSTQSGSYFKFEATFNLNRDHPKWQCVKVYADGNAEAPATATAGSVSYSYSGASDGWYDTVVELCKDGKFTKNARLQSAGGLVVKESGKIAPPNGGALTLSSRNAAQGGKFEVSVCE